MSRLFFVLSSVCLNAFAAPAGVTIGWANFPDHQAAFVLPVGDKVYMQRCTEEGLAPVDIEDCFGTTQWPNAATPFVSAKRVKAALAALKKADPQIATDKADLQKLLDARNKEILDFEKARGKLLDQIKQVEQDAIFIEGRLKDKTLPAEARANLEAEKTRLLHKSQGFSSERALLSSKILISGDYASKLGDELAAIGVKECDEKNFSTYLDNEEKNLFQGQGVRNLSSEEPFATMLGRFISSAPQFGLEWEGSEPKHDKYGGGIEYKDIALKRIRVLTAAAPGKLEVKGNTGRWGSGGFAIEVELTEAQLLGDAVVEGAALPAEAQKPTGVYSYRDLRQHVTEPFEAIVQGERLFGFQSNSTHQFELRPLDATLRGDPKLVADLPHFTMHAARAKASFTPRGGKKEEAQTYGSYNGLNGFPYCPPRVHIQYRLGDPKMKARFVELNGGKLAWTAMDAVLTLETSDKRCRYSGENASSLSAVNPILVDGVLYEPRN